MHQDGRAMWLLHPEDPHFRRHARLPQFLVISPPKTGSTWLAENLRRHPGLFVPAIKEVKYFSSLYKWADLGWYADHFAPAGGRVAGEASPSYASLPTLQIEAVRRLLPDVRLIFLMRDPVSRAWSHARHARRYREANFADDAGDGPVTDDRWRANFTHDWPLVGGDYLGQLRRWASVFPPEQLFVGFYESIAREPADLLRRLFAFLGVDPDVDLATFPIRERILEGPPGELPAHLEAELRRLLRSRTIALAGLLRTRFNLDLPPEWDRTLVAGPDAPLDHVPCAFAADEERLATVLAAEERFPTSYRQVHLGYRGYDIVFSRGRLVACPAPLGGSPEADERSLEVGLAEGACLTAPTLAELKELVTGRVLEEQAGRLRAAEASVAAARDDLRALAAEFRGFRDQTTAALRPSRIRRLAGKVKRLVVGL